MVISKISASPSPSVIRSATLGLVTSFSKSPAAVTSGLITLSIPTSINASSWAGLLTLAIIVGTLYFLTKIQDNRFASSFPVVAMKKSASSILVSSNNFELVPFPHITSALINLQG